VNGLDLLRGDAPDRHTAVSGGHEEQQKYLAVDEQDVREFVQLAVGEYALVARRFDEGVNNFLRFFVVARELDMLPEAIVGPDAHHAPDEGIGVIVVMTGHLYNGQPVQFARLAADDYLVLELSPEQV